MTSQEIEYIEALKYAKGQYIALDRNQLVTSFEYYIGNPYNVIVKVIKSPEQSLSVTSSDGPQNKVGIENFVTRLDKVAVPKTWVEQCITYKHLNENLSGICDTIIQNDTVESDTERCLKLFDKGNKFIDIGDFRSALKEFLQSLVFWSNSRRTFYNIACCYAHPSINDIHQALSYLELSFPQDGDNEYPLSSADYEEDPDFESIRREARYQNFIIRLKERERLKKDD